MAVHSMGFQDCAGQGVQLGSAIRQCSPWLPGLCRPGSPWSAIRQCSLWASRSVLKRECSGSAVYGLPVVHRLLSGYKNSAADKTGLRNTTDSVWLVNR